MEAAGLRWHLQTWGEGPAVLLVHGTGAATHSWRDLAPLLARHFTVIVPDLPGHGFSGPCHPSRLSLPGMASGLAELLDALQQRPVLVVGHSAGAAILARMSLDGLIQPRRLVSLNGALLPLRGLPGKLFSPVARLLAGGGLVPRFFARRAGEREAIERLIRGTGSTLEPLGVELYRRIAGNPGHVAAALGMMASWDLEPLARELHRLRCPMTLVVADNDRTISPREALRVRALLPSAQLVHLPGLGHLAHEERPRRVAALLLRLGRGAGVMTGGR